MRAPADPYDRLAVAEGAGGGPVCGSAEPRRRRILAGLQGRTGADPSRSTLALQIRTPPRAQVEFLIDLPSDLNLLVVATREDSSPSAECRSSGGSLTLPHAIGPSHTELSLPMTRFTHILLASVLLSGCAGASPARSSTEGDAEHRLDAALQKRDELSRQFAQNPPALRTRCEATAGDCLIALRERRTDLMKKYIDLVYLCPPTEDQDARFRCVVGKRDPVPGTSPTDRARQFGDYFTDEGACLDELIKCTGTQKKAAVVASQKATRKERRRQVETSPAAVSARSAVVATEEKVKYVRLTFPVQTDDICVPEDRETCLAQANEKLAALDAELAKDDAYDAKAALGAYQAGKQTELGCYQPELKCLLGKLPQFGATPETLRLVDRNFALIEERQKLASQVDDSVAQKCIQTGVEQHQADILQRYQDYVGQSKLYFRFQLERAFMAMHSSQVDCLKHRTKRSSG